MKMFGAFGPVAIRRRYIKDIDKHPYIEYKGYISDLTNDILFDMIWGFWGYFVMVLNTFYIKCLSDMSVLYVFAPGPPAAVKQPGDQTKLFFFISL